MNKAKSIMEWPRDLRAYQLASYVQKMEELSREFGRLLVEQVSLMEEAYEAADKELDELNQETQTRLAELRRIIGTRRLR